MDTVRLSTLVVGTRHPYGDEKEVNMFSSNVVLAAANAGTMYTSNIDVFVVDALMASIPAIIGLVLCIIFAEGRTWPWTIWQFVVALTFGAIFGKAYGFYLGCTIVSGVLFILLRWCTTRSWLFGSFLRGLITVVVILGFYAAVVIF